APQLKANAAITSAVAGNRIRIFSSMASPFLVGPRNPEQFIQICVTVTTPGIRNCAIFLIFPVCGANTLESNGSRDFLPAQLDQRHRMRRQADSNFRRTVCNPDFLTGTPPAESRPARKSVNRKWWNKQEERPMKFRARFMVTSKVGK
ncbi:MAG TPA: hypothetical protein VJ417_14120, partial [Candidatus Glassbacteria bacterium]|nr:hypothetical protein [Candidatus Glassbacteria bacterium]